MLGQYRLRLTIAALAAAVLTVAGCGIGAYDRNTIIEFAETKAHEPGFTVQTGSRGSARDFHDFFDGSFLVPLSTYETVDGGTVEAQDFLWEVYQRYLAVLENNIDFDVIPNMIATQRTTIPTQGAKRYDFYYESRDVSVRFDAEWFRGGPGAWENDVQDVQIYYAIRVN